MKITAIEHQLLNERIIFVLNKLTTNGGHKGCHGARPLHSNTVLIFQVNFKKNDMKLTPASILSENIKIPIRWWKIFLKFWIINHF